MAIPILLGGTRILTARNQPASDWIQAQEDMQIALARQGASPKKLADELEGRTAMPTLGGAQGVDLQRGMVDALVFDPETGGKRTKPLPGLIMRRQHPLSNGNGHLLTEIAPDQANELERYSPPPTRMPRGDVSQGRMLTVSCAIPIEDDEDMCEGEAAVESMRICLDGVVSEIRHRMDMVRNTLSRFDKDALVSKLQHARRHQERRDAAFEVARQAAQASAGRRARWAWQTKQWPKFAHEANRFAPRTAKFLEREAAMSGRLDSVARTSRSQRVECEVEALLSDVISTHAIEGETFNRDSVRASLLKRMGVVACAGTLYDKNAEAAVSLIVDARNKWPSPLSERVLCHWQMLALPGERHALTLVGQGHYRTGDMEISSGSAIAGQRTQVNYEAPPAGTVPAEMDRLLTWYNAGAKSLDPLERAGIAHVWFECIHPFDDGNGRVGRAISDHAMSQAMKGPTLACLSTAIERSKDNYYDLLERIGRGNMDLNPFLDYFSGAALEAQNIAAEEVNFVLNKTAFHNRFSNRLSPRQSRVAARMLRNGASGFKGGLSLRNYTGIGRCAEAEAEADIAALVKMEALRPRPGAPNPRYDIPRLPEAPRIELPALDAPLAGAKASARRCGPSP